MVASREAMQGAFDRMNGRLDALRSADHASIDPLTGLATVASSGAPLRNGVWMNTYGLSSRDSQHDGFAGFGANGYGLTVGLDRQLSATVVGGMSISYSDVDLSFHNQRVGDRSAVKSHQVSFYGSKDFSMGYVDAMLAYSLQRYDSRRNTTVNGIAHGRFDGTQWGARIGAGMPRMMGGGVKLTPKVALEWNRIGQESYTESRGGPLALNVGSSNARRWRTSLGFEIGRDTVLSDETVLEPYFRTFWNRDLSNDGVGSSASFVGGGTAFSVPGRELDRDTFTSGVGVNLYRGEGFTASLGYDLTLSGQSVAQVPQFSARWEF
jgi:outer membrane autotransporter protein